MRFIASLTSGASALFVALLLPGTAVAKDVVLVELFTSQGCSSCPPADQLLSNLGHERGAVEIVPLSFHVDYWNYIGWKDQFSSSKWSKRQRAYAAAMQSNRTYTPQLVVQGEIDCVGSNERCIRDAVRRIRSRGSTGRVTIERVREVGGSVFVEANAALAAGQPRVTPTVVVYESRLSTVVRRGENRGRNLRNDYVVRALREVSTIHAGDTSTRNIIARVPIQREWRTENLGVVVFLQETGSRRVLAAGRAPLAVER